MADCASSLRGDCTPALTAGDAVFGLARGSLGSHVVASTKALARLPPALLPAQAASAPTVFITADFALRVMLQNSHGDRCES